MERLHPTSPAGRWHNARVGDGKALSEKATIFAAKRAVYVRAVGSDDHLAALPKEAKPVLERGSLAAGGEAGRAFRLCGFSPFDPAFLQG